MNQHGNIFIEQIYTNVVCTIVTVSRIFFFPFRWFFTELHPPHQVSNWHLKFTHRFALLWRWDIASIASITERIYECSLRYWQWHVRKFWIFFPFSTQWRGSNRGDYGVLCTSLTNSIPYVNEIPNERYFQRGVNHTFLESISRDKSGAFRASG